MAHFDLEEQEKLAQIKHFWKQYGNLLTALLVVLVLALAGWWGWKAWQNHQVTQATALYEELERIAANPGADPDGARLMRAMTDMKDRFPRTAQAQQAALQVAAVHAQAGLTQPARLDAARAALQWLAEEGRDEGYRALARLRLAGLLLDAQSYDAALAQLSADFLPQFAPLAADRRGDIYLAQGKKTEAAAEYLKASQGLDTQTGAGENYKQLVDAKLAALGVQAPSAAPAGGR
ncbi:membrane protein [Hylemonella gracilis str. Niagara R]|uniref:Membrane protein n=1 Tax=Hylemonella gracilis str. Niagara R TaxID=1458275 RepID=A0A016XHB9_9BURK|nr:tetratricopeptide repeat protein [Hylemonella gracilis]EYC51251.1 membrane protein [Hylemonella gracilis str. Niagara R]